MSLYEYQLENILFIDIETVPQQSCFENLDENSQYLWKKKAKFLIKDPEKETVESIYERAGIYSEFGQIICISIGNVHYHKDKQNLRLKSIYGSNEKELLCDFKTLLENFDKKHSMQLAAHNGKEFDFPYIARRMLINGITLPRSLQVAGKKPWEVPFIDTLELWKFGDYKHYTSLEVLTHVFNIPTPKDDIDGSMVAKIFYEENDLNRIVIYCEKDVIAIVQIFLRFRGEPIILEDCIQSVTFT